MEMPLVEKKKMSIPLQIIYKIYTYFIPSAFMRAFINTIIFNFQPLAYLTMSYMLSCFSLETGDFVMIHYTNLKCWSTGDYWAWGALIIPVLILLIVGPTLAILFLILNRKRLNNTTFRNYFGLLYQVYKPNYFWFEWVFLTKKLLLILSTVVSQMLTISYGVDGVQYILYAIVISFTFIFVLAFNPYERRGDNAVEKLSLLITLLIIGVQEGTTQFSETIGVLLGALLMILCVVVILVYVVVQLPIVRKIASAIVGLLKAKKSVPSEIGRAVLDELPRKKIVPLMDDVALPMDPLDGEFAPRRPRGARDSFKDNNDLAQLQDYSLNAEQADQASSSSHTDSMDYATVDDNEDSWARDAPSGLFPSWALDGRGVPATVAADTPRHVPPALMEEIPRFRGRNN